ncbi:hypothetical protein HYT57_02475 [Candidatus Woesearchaeota archaeon]|nr:hypothetical protein [Candidatus Woesearchaeota archaeon]
MNKKGENLLHYVVPIILILLVLVLIITFSFSTTNFGKSVLKMLGLSDDNSLAQKNEEAQNSFKEFTKNLKQCSQYKEDNCFCNAPLAGFSDIHAVKASQKGVKIETVKDSSEVTLAEESIQHTSCYVSNVGFSVKDSLVIYFDEESAYTLVNGFIEDNKVRLLATNNIYKKQGNLCFITSDFVEKPKKCEK